MRQGLIQTLTLTLALALFSSTTLQAADEAPPSGSHLGSITGGDFDKAHLIIDNKCISCHSATRIEEALAAGKSMQEIQRRMEQKGVMLSTNERSVLGIFWKETPLKPRKSD